jgi:hypothetical protein
MGMKKPYLHLSYNWEKVKPFLNQVTEWFRNETGLSINLNPQEYLIGSTSEIPPIWCMLWQRSIFISAKCLESCRPT